jgi:hypothetical protein
MTPLTAIALFEAAGAVAVLVRMFQTGLVRSQPAHLCWLLYFPASSLILVELPPRSAAYFWVFVSFTLANWLLTAQVVREMFTLSLSAYPGIRTLARWTLYLSLAISVVISAIMISSRWDRGPHGDSHLYYIELADRVIAFTFAVIITGLLYFLSRYPLNLAHNNLVSCCLFSGILLTQAVADAVDSVTPVLYSASFDLAAMAVNGLLLLAWALLLRRRAWSPQARETAAQDDETSLLRQLQLLNSFLDRAGRG